MPKKKSERILFFKSKVPIWTAAAATLKLEPAAVTDLGNKVTAAEAALDVHTTAQSNARTKTSEFYSAVNAMTDIGTALISQIRTTAETGGEAIYQAADIPAPNPPSPQGPPGTPESFKVKLFQDGSLQLNWRCANPPGGGVIYHVYRRNDATGQFIFVGGTTRREFLDATIPAGSSQVTYKVQGVRPSGIGPVAEFNVNFGVGSGGGMTATVAAGPKLAA